MFNFQEMINDLKNETSGGGTQGLYQDIVIDGKVVCKGIRPILDRIKLIEEPKDSLIDIGCNVGSFCRYYKDNGVKDVYGIDNNEKFIKWAKILTPNAKFLQIDLNTDIKKFKPFSKFDTILFLAVWDYFKNKEEIVSYLKKIFGRVLYFEGHADGTKRINEDIYENGICYKSWRSILKDEMKINYEFIGMTDNYRRPLFKCWW